LVDLRGIVLEHGLDPAKKVRRWRKEENIIQFIVDAIEK
jgi:hypothetical protein